MTTEQQRKMLEAAAKACGYGELIFCNGADDDGYDNGVWKYTWRRDESGRLLQGLEDAATSLETIALRSYGDESYLNTVQQMRGYAGSRAGAARETLATTGPKP